MSPEPIAADTIVRNSPGSGANSDEPAEAAERGSPLRLTWQLRALLAGSLVIPVLLLVLALWEDFRLAQRYAEDRVLIKARELSGQDLSVFNLYPVVFEWITQRIGTRDWNQIAGDPDLHHLLANLEALPQIDAAWIVDAAGRVRAGSRFFPIPAGAAVSADDALTARQSAGIDTFIGRVHRDPLTGDRVFDIGRRLTAADGHLQGAVLLSVTPDYFRRLYAQVAGETEFQAWLIRTDGSVLASSSADAQSSSLASESPLMRAIKTARDGSAFRAPSPTDGSERIYELYRLPGFPIYAVLGVPTANMLTAWRANLLNYFMFALPLPLAVALSAMTWLAARQIRRERCAAWRWQTAKRRLQLEIDRRSRTEAELRQVQKIETVGQLTGGIAHDFNNLLAVMQGCLEILSGRQSDERLQKRVELGLETVARGLRLVRQLRAFADHRPAAVVGLDLNAELRGMSERLARTAGAGTEIVTDLATDLLPIDADPKRIELVVINLVSNACDAMPNGGRLLIRTANLPGPLVPDGGGEPMEKWVELEISDTGSGMPPEVAERAFEPFFTTKRAGRGTGLGLSMVDEFVRQAGGSATIRTAVGRGTSVTLRLPTSRGAGAAAEGLPASRPA